MACSSCHVFSLNVRGLRSKPKRKALFNFLKQKKYDIVCLQETYITKSTSEEWMREWKDGFVFHEGTSHSAGQIVLFGKQFGNDFSIVHSSKRIQAIVTEIGHKQVAVVNIYAPTEGREKVVFYTELNETIKNIECDELILCGDFNCVLDNKLDIVSGEKHHLDAVTKLNHLVESCDLYDTWRSFNPHLKEFTWSRRNPFVARRLDYIFTSSDIFDKVLNCDIVSVPFSDHRGCSVQIKVSETVRGNGYWKFNNLLLEDIEYVDEMNNLIESFTGDGVDSQTEWELLKISIREFTCNYSKRKHVERKNKTVSLSNELNDLDTYLGSNPQCDSAQVKRENVKMRLELLEVNKARAAQVRARIKWVEEGEKNTKYFLGLEKARGNAKIMESLKNAQGQVCTDQMQIHAIQKDYFSNLYKKKINEDDMSDKVERFVQECNVPSLADEQKLSCEGTLTEGELLNALKQMKNGSAPGSDGINIEFIKMFWTRLSKFILKSFSEAFDSGCLSHSQCKAIIVLIHKGKHLPRDELNNWRPISLTNSDYKLLAKCLALRMNMVIHDLVNPDQVGYIKGRQVSTLLRLIDDVSDQMNVQNKSGLLATIDMFHAFDCISKKFMIKTFEKFGFGPEFVRWVCVLMNDSKSCVNYVGWLSDFFPVESGIRQGCPFSPLAFVLAIELLAIKIRQSKNIKGIRNLNVSNSTLLEDFVKIALYADDITLFLENENDLKQAFLIFDAFSVVSGLKRNPAKCEAMWLGNKKHCQDEFCNLVWKRKLKILGIYYANDRSASHIEENWMERVVIVKRLISVWEKRNLSIMGKIIVIKTFLLSQFIYFMKAFVVPNDVLIEVNRLLFRFLWKKRENNKKAFEKVKRVVMCNDIEFGGLKMIDLKQMQLSFMLQWAVQLKTGGVSEKWKAIPRVLFSAYGSCFECFHSNVHSRLFKGITSIQSHFWRGVLANWLDNNTGPKDFVFCPLLWNNRLFTYSGHVMYFKEWAVNGIICMHDVLSNNEFVSYQYICQSIGNSPNRILEYNIVRSAVLSATRKFGDVHETELSEIPLFVGKKLFHAQQFRKELVTAQKHVPCSTSFWKRKFNYDIDEDEWLISFRSSNETRLRVLQWKILHNIYPTNILLSKMKVTESNLCSYCSNSVDFIEHFFFQCPKTNIFWKYIESFILCNFDEKVVLNVKEVLFGLRIPQNRACHFKKINHIILIGKMCISIYKKTNSSLPLETLFDIQIQYRKV